MRGVDQHGAVDPRQLKRRGRPSSPIPGTGGLAQVCAVAWWPSAWRSRRCRSYHRRRRIHDRRCAAAPGRPSPSDSARAVADHRQTGHVNDHSRWRCCRQDSRARFRSLAAAWCNGRGPGISTVQDLQGGPGRLQRDPEDWRPIGLVAGAQGRAPSKDAVDQGDGAQRP
ncbi:hypothetical protein ACU4GD_41530 [Cupriavidus basilensis]